MSKDVLRHLSDTVTVRHIMTPLDQLERADSVAEAEVLHVKYDLVPYPKRGRITGFFLRNETHHRDIEPSLLLADSTNVVDMPRLLLENHFFFVMTSNAISGYVHYSDMNKTVAVFPLLTVLLSAERALWEELATRIDDEDLVAALGKQRAHLLRKKKAKMQDGNVDVGWLGLFTICDVLKLANHYELIHATPDEIKEVGDVRNRCAHSGRPLITKEKDFSKLERVRLFCEAIISWHRSR